MVFLAKGGKTYKLRVDHPDGRHAVLTTQCVVKADADDIEALVHQWQGRKGKRLERLDVIDALVDHRITLPRAVEAYHDRTIDALVAGAPAIATVLDLLVAADGGPSILDRWIASKKKSGKGVGQADTYRKQIRTLFPETPFPLDLFSRKEVWARLEALDVDAPTKNRYRTAASSLAKYLVAAELLNRNFVRDVEGYGENDPRLVYYEIADAKRLVDRLAQPYAGLAAMSLAFCMEWGALTETLVGDVAVKADPITAHVRGTKTGWRDRVVPLVPELAFLLKYIRPLLKGKTPSVRIFEGVHEWTAIDTQRSVARALGIVAVGEGEFNQHSIHDWRQTHTVALLRWGYAEQIAADHLGHANTTLVRKNYGRFRSNQFDYAKGAAITDPITSPKHAKGGKSRT